MSFQDGSDAILREYAETAWKLKLERGLAENPQPWLNWINSPATISRVPWGGRADYIASRDRHLLVLGKPFGIRVVGDREFLAILREG